MSKTKKLKRIEGKIINDKPLEKIEPATTKEITTPATLLAMAVEQGADVDKLEKLMNLQERWEKTEAKKSYIVAMNQFKENPPEIFKNKHVEYETTKGTTAYNHASLDNVVAVISESLASNGLSHRWDVVTLDGGQIKVTCVVTHKQGHSECVSLQSGSDQSGGKNNIQAIGSTVTYLQRYTLLSVVGLATKEMDDDGAGAGSEFIELISEEQSNSIYSRIQDHGLGMDRFMKWLKTNLKVSKIEDINVKGYGVVDALLESKIKGKQK